MVSAPFLVKPEDELERYGFDATDSGSGFVSSVPKFLVPIAKEFDRRGNQTKKKGGGGAYVAPAVNFDNGGIAQFIPDFAAAAITSPTSPTNMLMAGWFGQLVGSNGMNWGSLGNNDAIGAIFVNNGSGGITAQCIGFSQTDQLFSIHTVTINSDPILWHSWAISINAPTKTFQLLVDRVLIDTSGITWTTGTDLEIGLNDGDGWDLGFDNLNPGSFSISDTRFGAGEGFFDLTVTSNVNKLFSPTNKPISWGADGSLVTGSAPMIFTTGDATTYQNHGPGGPFVLTGTLTNASTSPSD